LEEPLQESDKAAQGIGLIINQEKKYMRVSKKTHNQCKQIATGGYRFARESSFLTWDQ